MNYIRDFCEKEAMEAVEEQAIKCNAKFVFEFPIYC